MPEFGVRLARGFRISLFSNSDLANDIYAMTLDSRGNVVVTGREYIRTLLDTDGNGVADTAREFASTRTGGMGMCFDGTTLYFVGDGALFRYIDANADGVADGPPQRLLPMEFLEHGGHAVRKGPDGWFYVIVGNETTITNAHMNLPGSPIRRAEGGALLRLTPDGQNCEIIAHGFRNSCDFDFNVFGDIFTYDSDVESDSSLVYAHAHLPRRARRPSLMALARLASQLELARLLPGCRRYSRTPRAWLADRRGMLSPLSIPLRYRNGIFALDWTFGRIFFLPMTPSGTSYETTPEVFLEPIGSQGFAPTDVVVSTDGSLLVSIGGRNTRGAVFRIEYVAERNANLAASNWVFRVANLAEAALAAPQPYDAWSRAYWEAVATELGPGAFIAAAADNSVAPGIRMRGIEIVTQVHGGLPPSVAFDLARELAGSPRARRVVSGPRAR